MFTGQSPKNNLEMTLKSPYTFGCILGYFIVNYTLF